MVVRHYYELLQQHRRWLALFVAGVTVAVAVGSTVMLWTSPVFTATVNVTVLPSQSELSFGREATGGPGPTARSLTATYIEYLKSRPVVEATLERIAATGETAPRQESGGNPVSRLVRGARGLAQRVYRLIDSGRYAPNDPQERAVGRLMGAINVSKVEDSYILKIEVSLPDPDEAAMAANTLAEAYVQSAAEQLEASAKQMQAFLGQEIRLREAQLDTLAAREEALKEQLSISSLDSERELLMQSRAEERESLVDAEIALEGAAAELRRLEEARDVARSGRNLADLEQELSLARSRNEAATRSVALRRENLWRISSEIARLNDESEPLRLLERQRELTISELAELNSRKLTSDLSQSIALTQLRVIDPARVPRYPSSPRVVRNTVAGLIVALLGALATLVVLDTLSTSVKTTADLDRVAGGRSLGRASRRLVRRVAEAPPDELAQDPGLRSFAAELDRRLILARTFRHPRVHLSGMAREEDLIAVAEALRAALELRWGPGKLAIVDASSRPPGVVRREAGTEAPEAGTGTPEPSAEVELIRQAPLTSRTDLEAWAAVSESLILVVTAGQVPEESLTALVDRATGSGLTRTAVILLEA